MARRNAQTAIAVGNRRKGDSPTGRIPRVAAHSFCEITQRPFLPDNQPMWG